MIAKDLRPMRLFLHTVGARSYPRIVAHWRQTAWMLMDVAFPLVGTLAMVFVYQGLHAPKQYLGFVVMGGAMLAFWQNVLWMMATQFSWDRDNGTLELYAISPTSYEAILLGMAVGAMPPVTLRAGFIVAICSLFFGVQYHLAGLLPAAGVFLLTISALYCLGMMLASLFLFYGREAWHLANALQEPVNFISGLYFPVRALGSYLAGAASLIPVSLGLDAIRQLLLPGTFQLIPVGLETFLVAIQIPLYASLAYGSLRTMEARARRDGKLINKWA